MKPVDGITLLFYSYQLKTQLDCLGWVSNGGITLGKMQSIIFHFLP